MQRLKSQQSWASSPFGRNSLLALLKNNVKQSLNKYQEVQTALRNKENFKSCNKIFYSKTSNLKRHLNSAAADVKQVDFQNIQSTFMTWLQEHATFEAFPANYLSTSDGFLLANISTFTDKWNNSVSQGAVMKIYNSFSYTEDIRYEARLLELPMLDNDFKLVILLPNEVDVLNNLFKKLTTEGLTAATGCISPLFISVCKLKAPDIVFISTTNKIQERVKNLTLASTEIGNVKITEKGISIKVLTCFSSHTQTEVSRSKFEKVYKPFYFAIIFKDMPLFTGFYESTIK